MVELHGYRGLQNYELALSDMTEGTAVTNETDMFGRYVLEAQDSIASLTVQGDETPRTRSAVQPRG